MSMGTIYVSNTNGMKLIRYSEGRSANPTNISVITDTKFVHTNKSGPLMLDSDQELKEKS